MHNIQASPDLYTKDWLSKQNDIENKEIADMNINIGSINITTYRPTFITTKDIQAVRQDDMHLPDPKLTS